jgi:hypothetical protein
VEPIEEKIGIWINVMEHNTAGHCNGAMGLMTEITFGARAGLLERLADLRRVGGGHPKSSPL